MKKILLTVFGLLCLISAQGQTTPYQQDVTTIDNIMYAIYDVISGSADEPRDWERFHYLFAKDAKLIPTGKNPADSTIVYRYWSPEDYQKMFTANRTSFFERELHRETQAFGNIVHVFSTYETKTEKNGPVVNRGINSFQIFKGKDRYYIMNIFWSAESDGYTLPEKYLDQ